LTAAARFVAGPGLLLLAGLASANEPAGSCDPDAEAAREVRAIAEGIVAADNARDIGRVLAYYAADAVLMPPGEPPVTDAAEIRRRYEGLFERFDPAIEARIEEICIDGALAVVRGHNGGRLASRQGGDARLLDDVYLMVLRPDGEDGWRISRLMWHRASAAAP
jgi:ketosteroid isomerase-like protein